LDKTAYIFDFDDTLSHSESEIKLYPFRDSRSCMLSDLLSSFGHKMNEKPERIEHIGPLIEHSVLSPCYNEVAWRLKECGIPLTTDSASIPIGDCVVADFSDFISASPTKPIQRYMEMASKCHMDDLFVCTGRHPSRVHPSSNQVIDARKMILDFMSENGIFMHPDNVMCVGDMKVSTPEAKAATILGKVIPQGYKRIVFVDDCEKNIESVYSACYPFCDVTTLNAKTGIETSSPQKILQQAREKRLSAGPLSRLRSMAGLN